MDVPLLLEIKALTRIRYITVKQFKPFVFFSGAILLLRYTGIDARDPAGTI